MIGTLVWSDLINAKGISSIHFKVSKVGKSNQTDVVLCLCHVVSDVIKIYVGSTMKKLTSDVKKKIAML